MEVYIVFTDTKTVLSKLIKLYTRHSYSHVSIAFDKQLTHMYSFGRKDVDNAFNGGFIQEDIRNKLFQRAQSAVFKCEVSENGYENMKKHLQTLHRKQNLLKYNFKGMVGILLNQDFEREDAYFCSQFVAELLLHGNIGMTDKPARRVMPSDIYYDDKLELVYSGPLCNYPFFDQEAAALEEQPLLLEV